MDFEWSLSGVEFEWRVGVPTGKYGSSLYFNKSSMSLASHLLWSVT